MASHRCYTIRKGEGRGIHIPGCWGCATQGHHACTCDQGKSTTPKADRSIEARLDAIEKQLATLVSRAKSQGG